MEIFYFIAGLIWAIIWGFATQKVIENKGYYENWFIWGFLFGFIAFIVALTKPDCQSNSNYTHGLKYTEAVSSSRPPINSWRCSCGTYNPTYVTTCPDCGKSINQGKRPIHSSESTDWRCECGALNTAKERTCHRCGKPYVSPYRPLIPSGRADETKEQIHTQPSKDEDDAIKALKNYKDLLDSGVISQEEFDAKKKQLLGL